VEPSDLELLQDGLHKARHVLAMNFFVRGPLRRHSDAVVAAYRRWISIAGAQRFRFYATETMSKHAKVNAKTLEMLPTWLTEAGAERKFVSIELKDGDVYNDTPRWLLKVHSEEARAADPSFDRLALVQLAWPPDEGLLDIAQDYFLDVCRTLPVRYAAAGHAMLTSPYFEEDSQTFAWARSMRHPGLDLLVGINDLWAVRRDGVKTVNWLTMIDAALAGERGGSAALTRQVSAPVAVIELPTGLVFRAGATPELGDVNRGDPLDAYRQVHRLLRPFVARAASRAKSFSIRADDGTSTERWYTRFDATD